MRGEIARTAVTNADLRGRATEGGDQTSQVFLLRDLRALALDDLVAQPDDVAAQARNHRIESIELRTPPHYETQ